MGVPLERALLEASKLALEKESVVVWDDDNIAIPELAASTERPLPSQYLPEALPLFLFFLVVSGTMLYFLMRQWFVWFVVACEYEPVYHLQEEMFVHVIPLPHRGKAKLCALDGNGRFEFQRQTYVLLKGGELMEPGEVLLSNDEKDEIRVTSDKTLALAREKGLIRVLLATANLPVNTYLSMVCLYSSFNSF